MINLILLVLFRRPDSIDATKDDANDKTHWAFIHFVHFPESFIRCRPQFMLFAKKEWNWLSYKVLVVLLPLFFPSSPYIWTKWNGENWFILITFCCRRPPYTDAYFFSCCWHVIFDHIVNCCFIPNHNLHYRLIPFTLYLTIIASIRDSIQYFFSFSSHFILKIEYKCIYSNRYWNIFFCYCVYWSSWSSYGVIFFLFFFPVNFLAWFCNTKYIYRQSCAILIYFLLGVNLLSFGFFFYILLIISIIFLTNESEETKKLFASDKSRIEYSMYMSP